MIHLLYGPDELARSEALLTLRNQIPPDLVSLNVTYLDGRKLKLEELAVACEAHPFLADQRLIIVTDALKHTKAGKERDALRSYLERIPATCQLVFVESGDVDRRSSLFTYLKKSGQVQEFVPLQGKELARWLNERARVLNVRLDNDAAKLLVDYVGNDSRMLLNELEKLSSYSGRGGRITKQAVDLLVYDGQEHNMFAFLDSLSLRQRASALEGLRGLFQDGQSATYILFMLMRQARILLQVQELASKKMRPDDIAATIQQKPFVVRKALEQARNFRTDELAALHDRLLTLDQATKTGRMQAEVALEILVMETCESQRRPGVPY